MVKEIIHNLNAFKPGFYQPESSTKFVLFLQLFVPVVWCYRSKKKPFSIAGEMQENFLMFFCWHKQIISIDKII
jgi:hypothetical protein